MNPLVFFPHKVEIMDFLKCGKFAESVNAFDNAISATDDPILESQLLCNKSIALSGMQYRYNVV